MNSRIHKLKQDILRKGISVFDCFDHYSLDDVYDGTRREQQIKCPGFHGEDRKKSARVYENGTMYCWACGEHYDVFSFEMRYAGKSFSEAVYELANRYGIEVVSDEDEDEESENQDLAEIKSLFRSFESNKSKKKFDSLREQVSLKLVAKRDLYSLEEYQNLWYLVDQISWRVFCQEINADQAIVYLETLYTSTVKQNV